jgi:hypothetical protein
MYGYERTAGHYVTVPTMTEEAMADPEIRKFLPTGIAPPGTAAHPFRLLAAFVAAIFLSAALLFAVQPMFTKMVLPRLGGSPSVWSVGMVFFQAALLAGYAYAHILTSYMPSRSAILIHLGVMVAASFALPLAIASGWSQPPASGTAIWLIGLYTISIGLPFFALAANGPLLQAWFSRTDHPAAHAPYFLYAASNIGSFLALILYPTVIEPFIRLGDQTRLWSAGFYALITLIALCGALLWRSNQAVAPKSGSADRTDPPSWTDAGIWAAVAAVPAGLLVAVTAHISTDVAAVPLLWVLPLSLYLLTFVIVFQSRPILPHRLVVAVQPVFILGLLIQIIYEPAKSIMLSVGIHLACFFMVALVCHGELARRRPPAYNLTSFYLWMSTGGMIGGIAAGLVAPYVFTWVAEYPILIALAVLCRPGLAVPRGMEQFMMVGGLATAVALLIAWPGYSIYITEILFNAGIGALLAFTVLAWRTPLAFAGIVAFILSINHLYADSSNLLTVRSFFTVHKISESPDGRFRVLTNGTTIHGAQRIRDANDLPVNGRPEPITYYYDGSGMAQIMDAVRERAEGPINYAVIGLGTGTLACRAQPTDTVHYYEIDPAIIGIARNPLLFNYLSECRPDVPIIFGDARQRLADASDGEYDIIYVDAFSSDAIPIHLLTSEAMALYRRKLSPHGIVAVHVSNRHLELASVVAGIASANGMIARVNDGSDAHEDDTQYRFSGTVVAVARSDQDFGGLTLSSYWQVQEVDPMQWVWTDDYSNIVGAVVRQLWPASSP